METEPQKTSHDISIALIQKDIEYIKQNVTGINNQLQLMDKNYARHDDLTAVMKALDGKVNNADFEPFKTTLSRINWLIIAAIVGGILVVVFKL